MTSALWSDERVADRMNIHDALSRYCHAVDRIDLPALSVVFHADAVIDNGASKLAASDFIAHVGERQPKVVVGFHVVGNVVIDFLGPNRAFVESYGLALEVHPPGSDAATIERVAHVRYGDVFERRSGTWRIGYRIVVLDHLSLVPVDPRNADPIPASHFVNRHLGVRGPTDPISRARRTARDHD